MLRVRFRSSARRLKGRGGPRSLVQLHDGWLNPPAAASADLEKRTLTNLYDQRPAELANAHAHLGAAVLAAYGGPADLVDVEEQMAETSSSIGAGPQG